MVHVLEHSEFPVGPLGVDGGLEGPGQLLDGHLGEGAVLQSAFRIRRRADLEESYFWIFKLFFCGSFCFMSFNLEAISVSLFFL